MTHDGSLQSRCREKSEHASLPHSSPCLSPKVLTVLARVAFSATLTVDNVGGLDVYPTIQGAINAAAPGDTILVRKNSRSTGWQEEIEIPLIKSGLILRGEDPVAASKSYFIGDRGGGDNKINDQCGIFCTIWKLIVEIFHFITFGLFEGNPPASPTGAPTTRSPTGAPVTASPTGAPTPDDGLDEVFCPDTILDGERGTILLVNAPNVIIENFTFRFGYVEFGTGSDGSIFRDNCYFPYVGEPLDTPDGLRNNLVIKNNQFFGGQQETMDLACTGCTVSYNTLRPCDSGILLTG
jgi:hypothetical protein